MFTTSHKFYILQKLFLISVAQLFEESSESDTEEHFDRDFIAFNNVHLSCGQDITKKFRRITVQWPDKLSA